MTTPYVTVAAAATGPAKRNNDPPTFCIAPTAYFNPPPEAIVALPAAIALVPAAPEAKDFIADAPPKAWMSDATITTFETAPTRVVKTFESPVASSPADDIPD